MRCRMQEVPTAVIRRDNAALFGLAMMPLIGLIVGEPGSRQALMRQ